MRTRTTGSGARCASRESTRKRAMRTRGRSRSTQTTRSRRRTLPAWRTSTSKLHRPTGARRSTRGSSSPNRERAARPRSSPCATVRWSPRWRSAIRSTSRPRNARGETLGQVEPKVAQRLIDLMNGGNKYAAALMSVEEGAPRIIIHEVFQHPSQVGKVSFPTRGDAAAAVRPYTKESLLKYADYDEEDEDAELDHEMMSETDGEVEEPLETAEFGDEDTPE